MSVRQSEACPCCSAVLRVALEPPRGSRSRRRKRLGAVVEPLCLRPEDIPIIGYKSVPDLLHLPTNMYFGEVSGVAVNSKGHVFVLSRGNTTGPAYARRLRSFWSSTPRASSSARSARTSMPGRSATP